MQRQRNPSNNMEKSTCFSSQFIRRVPTSDVETGLLDKSERKIHSDTRCDLNNVNYHRNLHINAYRLLYGHSLWCFLQNGEIVRRYIVSLAFHI